MGSARSPDRPATTEPVHGGLRTGAQLAQLHRDVDVLLEKITNSDDRRDVARYARWHLLPSAHSRLPRTGLLTRGQRSYLRAQLHAARMFVTDLRTAGTPLASTFGEP